MTNQTTNISPSGVEIQAPGMSFRYRPNTYSNFMKGGEGFLGELTYNPLAQFEGILKEEDIMAPQIRDSYNPLGHLKDTDPRESKVRDSYDDTLAEIKRKYAEVDPLTNLRESFKEIDPLKKLKQHFYEVPEGNSTDLSNYAVEPNLEKHEPMIAPYTLSKNPGQFSKQSEKVYNPDAHEEAVEKLKISEFAFTLPDATLTVTRGDRQINIHMRYQGREDPTITQATTTSGHKTSEVDISDIFLDASARTLVRSAFETMGVHDAIDLYSRQTSTQELDAVETSIDHLLA